MVRTFTCLLQDISADVAQLVEHHLGKVEVTGSIPVISSHVTGVAQLVEQRSPKPQVAGSIPAARAIILECVMLAQTKAFVNDVSKEMKKVSWPTREQLRESTVVVIVTCLIFTAIVAVIDLGMTQLMKQVY